MSDETTHTDAQALSPPRRRGPWRALLLLLLLGIASFFALREWQHRAPSHSAEVQTAAEVMDTTSIEVVSMQKRMAQMEERVALLETKTEEHAKTTKENNTDTVDASQADAPKPLEVLQMGQEIAELRTTLTNLRAETRAQGLPVRNLQLWVQLQQVQQSVNQGGAIALPIAQLQESWVGSAAAELEALRILARIAEQRVPTEAALMEDFVQLRGDVSVGLLQKEAGLWARMKAMLREQVRVRKLNASGEALPNDPLAALDEAQDALAQGNIAEAIRRVEAVPQGKAAFEPWLEAAQRRVDAQKAVEALQQALLSQLNAQPLPRTREAAHDDETE